MLQILITKNLKKDLKKHYQELKFSYRRCSKWNHKGFFFFGILKQNLISDNTSNTTNSVKPQFNLI